MFQSSLSPGDVCRERKLHNTLGIVVKVHLLDIIVSTKGIIVSHYKNSWHFDHRFFCNIGTLLLKQIKALAMPTKIDGRNSSTTFQLQITLPSNGSL
jgi:hypothetical protein